MKKILIMMIAVSYVNPAFSNANKCISKIDGYKVVENSVHAFFADKQDRCFFAFYTKNPELDSDNKGDALWYAYYNLSDPKKIYEFPKPSQNNWGNVCDLKAVSFQPMYDEVRHNVTVVGSCSKYDSANYTYPFIFTWQDGKYILDENIYYILSGFINPSSEFLNIKNRAYKDYNLSFL